jgi:hypothetical protein
MHRMAKWVAWRLSSVVVSSWLLAASGCAAMHEQQVANLRANGEHERAACYQSCGPSGVVCMKQCDNSHPPEIDPRLAQYAQVAAAAAAVDAAKAKPATTTPPPPSSASSEVGAQRNLTINGHSYSGGEHLGKPCSLDAPCPAGYSCHLVTSRSGQCVQ